MNTAGWLFRVKTSYYHDFNRKMAQEKSSKRYKSAEDEGDQKCAIFYFGIGIEVIYSEFPSDRLGDITWDTVMSSGQKFESIIKILKTA